MVLIWSASNSSDFLHRKTDHNFSVPSNLVLFTIYPIFLQFLLLLRSRQNLLVLCKSWIQCSLGVVFVVFPGPCADRPSRNLRFGAIPIRTVRGLRCTYGCVPKLWVLLHRADQTLLWDWAASLLRRYWLVCQQPRCVIGLACPRGCDSHPSLELLIMLPMHVIFFDMCPSVLRWPSEGLLRF